MIDIFNYISIKKMIKDKINKENLEKHVQTIWIEKGLTLSLYNKGEQNIQEKEPMREMNSK